MKDEGVTDQLGPGIEIGAAPIEQVEGECEVPEESTSDHIDQK